MLTMVIIMLCVLHDNHRLLITLTYLLLQLLCRLSEWILAGQVKAFNNLDDIGVFLNWDWEVNGITEPFTFSNQDNERNRRLGEDTERWLMRNRPNVPMKLNFIILDILAEFFGLVEDFWNNNIKPVFNLIEGGIDAAIESIGVFLVNVGEDSEKFFVDAFNEVSEFTTQTVNDAIAAVEDTWNDALSFFRDGDFFDTAIDE